MKNLRRIISLSLFTGLFLSLNFSSTYAKTIAVPTEDSVEVLSMKDSNEEIVANLNSDDEVEVIGTDDNYYVVALENDKAGYVLKDSLDIDSISGISTGDRVNIRQQPNTSCKVFGQVNNNDPLTITGKFGDWYQIDYDGREAYIYGEYVKANDEVFLKEEDTKEPIESSQTADEVIEYAKRFIGTPYRYGGTDLSSGIDCSAFTQTVMGHSGVVLSRTSRSQASDGVAVAKDELQPGDLVFFDTSGSNNGVISHVGIYIGNNDFIHASTSYGVTISNLEQNYYRRTYVKAVRVMD